MTTRFTRWIRRRRIASWDVRAVQAAAKARATSGTPEAHLWWQLEHDCRRAAEMLREDSARRGWV